MPDYFVKDGDEYTPLDENTVVLPKSELDSKYEPKAKFGEAVQAEVSRRFSNHVHKDKAHEDDTVIARVLESHGGKDVDQDALRKQWETAHLKPVSDRLTKAEQRAQALEDRTKYRELVPVLKEAGFGDGFLTRPEPGKPSPAELYLGDKFELDENANLRVKDTAVTPADFAKELASPEGPYKAFLRPESRNESGAGRPGQQGGGGGKSSGLTQSALSKDSAAKAEYILKNGYSESKGGGVPFLKLPK